VVVIFVVTRSVVTGDYDYRDVETEVIGAELTEVDAKRLIQDHACPPGSDPRTFTYHGPASYRIHETILSEGV